MTVLNEIYLNDLKRSIDRQVDQLHAIGYECPLLFNTAYKKAVWLIDIYQDIIKSSYDRTKAESFQIKLNKLKNNLHKLI